MTSYFILDYWWMWNAGDIYVLGIQVMAVIFIYTLPLAYFAYGHLLRPPVPAACQN